VKHVSFLKVQRLTQVVLGNGVVEGSASRMDQHHKEKNPLEHVENHLKVNHS
jgi:hypothetical protein